MEAFEVNFDGLVGPTHHYAGLAFGNIASAKYASRIANPKAGALQGLKKMHLLMQLGLKQAVLVPHHRPDLRWLKRLGFTGTLAQILDKAYHYDPRLLAACYSASSMWAANAATVSPSADTGDNRVHITPANLTSQFHRHQEVGSTVKLLSQIFSNENYFVIHDYLPCVREFADEGAANHIRLCQSYAEKGLEIFAYGKEGFVRENIIQPKSFPARQTYDASMAVARLHKLNPEHIIFAQQNPDAIDQGVFHNDVVALSNRQVLLFHEHAFQNSEKLKTALKNKANFAMFVIEVAAHEISLKDALETYFFNSQLVSIGDQRECLIAPIECQQHKKVSRFIDKLIAADNPIKQVHFVDVRESMHNGGGPACLRLRVVLTLQEFQAIHQGVLLTQARYQQLTNWVERYYRDRLSLDDLRDPNLLRENQAALEELTHLLQLTSI